MALKQPDRPLEPEPPREPALNELCSLTQTGLVAYAVRCARRMQPRFVLPPETPDADKMAAVVEAAIRWAEQYAAHGTGAIEDGARLAELALAVSEATSEHTDYAAYAAHHAVRGAVLAAQARQPADEVYLEIVASGFGASRVLLANLPIWLRQQGAAVLRDDYDKIVRLALGQPPQQGMFLDATATGPLGPLWPGAAPTW
jgi:hypothetical protein